MTGVRSAALTAIALAAVTGVVSVASAAHHSEPSLRLATIEGTGYVGTSHPRGHAHRRGTRGIKVSAEANGRVVAAAVTSATGSFRLAVHGGTYKIAAVVGPPTATPPRSCGAPVRVKVSAREHLRVSLICNLR